MDLKKSPIYYLFSELPNEEQLKEFKEILKDSRNLPKNFARDVIMKAPSKDIMNSLTKSILTLASYDEKVSDLSLDNVLRQCLTAYQYFSNAIGLRLSCL